MLKPINDKVVIKYIEKNNHTKSGIILTSQTNEDIQYAEIIEVGPGTDNIKIQVKKGQKVFVKKNTGYKINYEGEDFIIINHNDILSVDVTNGDDSAMHP